MFETLNAIPPLPHVFPQPPFPLEREPTASAPRGDTLSTRIDEHRSIVMSLRFVRRLRNNTAQSLVLRTQGLPHGKNKRTSACISKMKAKFLSCGKRSTKNQGEQLQLVVVEAKGACVRRKLGVRFSRRLAARTLNKHISFIGAL